MMQDNFYSFIFIVVQQAQNACAMAGFGVLIKFQFHYLHLSRGTGRNWSVLAFRCASLPSPPIPATAQAQTISMQLPPDS